MRQGEKIQLAVAVTNAEAQALSVTFVPTCDCLTVDNGTQSIPPGGNAAFILHYNSVDDTGNIRRGFLVTTDLPGAKPISYMIYGTVRQERDSPAQGAAWSRADTAANLTVSYFYTPGCRSCEEFLSVEIPRLSRELGIGITVEKRDLLDPATFEQLSREAAVRGRALTEVPVLLAGDTLLVGEKEIRARLSGILADLAAGQPRAAAPQSAASPGGVPRDLALLPVLAAGLIDGINPCAFTTLIFLLASLALAGRGRREVLLIGALFSAAVFLTYFLIGLGFFAALRAASAVPLVSTVLRWVARCRARGLCRALGLRLYAHPRGPADGDAAAAPLGPQETHPRLHPQPGAHRRPRGKLPGAGLPRVHLRVRLHRPGLPAHPGLPRAHPPAGHAAVLFSLLYNLCFIAPAPRGLRGELPWRELGPHHDAVPERTWAR